MINNLNNSINLKEKINILKTILKGYLKLLKNLLNAVKLAASLWRNTF